MNGGSRAPTGTDDELVSFSGAYSTTDADLINDFYSQCLTGALSVSFSSAPAAAQPTTGASATPSASVGSVTHYAQCGGINHKGDTACVAPYSCVVRNKSYSQCI
ncbi:hypothetical protein BDQ17DRAFT_1454697 [Cyathus striatus]|nr:hypothetical protein BDQ17DRAFT_1454697 [Cyathus striatus]